MRFCNIKEAERFFSIIFAEAENSVKYFLQFGSALSIF